MWGRKKVEIKKMVVVIWRSKIYIHIIIGIHILLGSIDKDIDLMIVML